ncbi:hypothetical protein [Chitinophaga arvensicola]|uniref:Uncharacterized protein n=1 Tax=Chitinophaga arvensicola TaxID=29529 RepID=A0A1I0SB73_9BACT|nr:hypothetical protein [Chitinophaga arvensicola]SEW53819.1 hypothetical protein SAMN04488122_5698 [Chitinophaga arvensicola]
MNNSFEINYIRKCLALAEARLNRGESSEWTSYDIEKLSIAIEEATGVTLSVTTLKRLWGKLKYTNMPATTTLNTLAQFVGYADWGEFKRGVAEEQMPQRTREQDVEGGITPKDHTRTPTTTGAYAGKPPEEGNNAFVQVPDGIISGMHATEPLPAGNSSPVQYGLPARRRYWLYWLLGLLPLAALVYTLLLSHTKPGRSLSPENFTFSSNKIMLQGVPNSVIFSYDATAAGADSVFISQSWDVRRKVAVSAREKNYSSIYYYPGYFRAKLMVNKQIVKEHDLMISSGGWLALIEPPSEVPLYFRKTEVVKGNSIEVDKALLAQYHVPLQPNPPAVRFFYVQSFQDLRNDHFTFETTLKSDYQQGTAACQRVEVLILCKDDVIIIPLSAKGCVGDLSLYAAGASVSSRDADLSRFGCDLSQWVKLRVVAKDRHIQFFVNDSMAAELNFPHYPTEIVGLQYRFNGTAAVKDTRFTKDSAVIDLQ